MLPPALSDEASPMPSYRNCVAEKEPRGAGNRADKYGKQEGAEPDCLTDLNEMGHCQKRDCQWTEEHREDRPDSPDIFPLPRLEKAHRSQEDSPTQSAGHREQ